MQNVLLKRLNHILKFQIAGESVAPVNETLKLEGDSPLIKEKTFVKGFWLSAWQPGLLFGLLFVSGGLWLWALPGFDYRAINDYGAAFNLPVPYFLAIGLLTAGFLTALGWSKIPSWLLLLYVVLLIFIIHGTLAVAYEAPRYSWTYKHIGVASYIQQYGTVNPAIDIYHNWPGFFAFVALFTRLAGLDNALGFAAWAQVIFNLLYLGPLLFIFKALSQDRRLIWLCVWFFYLGNWVAQDYFSPQATGYFFYLVFLGMCLAYFKLEKTPESVNIKRWLRFTPLVSLFQKIIKRSEVETEQRISLQRYQVIGLKLTLLLIFVGLVATHPLTPYMTLPGILAMILFQRLGYRKLPLLMIVIMGFWLLFPAETYMTQNTGMFSYHFFRLFDNLSNNNVDLSGGTAGHIFISNTARVLSVIIFGLALIGGIRRFHRTYRDLPVALLIISPFPMFLLQDYGGEMIYRVFLFSLPWTVFFAASAFFPGPASGASRKTFLLTGVVSFFLLLMLVVAYYGNERMNNFSQDELQAAEYLYQTVPTGSLLLKPSFNFPYKFESNYNQYVEMSVVDDPDNNHIAREPASLQPILDLMTAKNYPAAYFVFSRSQRQYIELAGKASSNWFDDLHKEVQNSKDFRLVFSNMDTEIYILNLAATNTSLSLSNHQT
ncbi:MAG TPA: hypothetical protein VH186_07740 [Chloroflexia bacterium]|nr:hypothetical protein [Chloroflexia bacterium]